MCVCVCVCVRIEIKKNVPITSSKHPVFELQSWVSLTAVSTEAEGISEITINGQFLASTCQGSNEQRQFTSINALNGYKISLSLSLSLSSLSSPFRHAHIKCTHC